MNENNNLEMKPKNGGKSIIIIICVLVVVALTFVYVFSNERATYNTIKKIEKSGKEAVGSNIVDYLNKKSLNDIFLNVDSSVTDVEGEFHVNFGDEMLTVESSINTIDMFLLLNNEVGVINFGSKNDYGFDATTFGRDVNDYLYSLGQQPIDGLDDLSVAYDKDKIGLKELKSSKAYKDYSRYQSKLFKQFSRSVDKEKLRGQHEVEKDDVYYKTRATKYTANPEDVETLFVESTHAFLLFVEGQTKGSDYVVNYEKDKISNEQLSQAFKEFSNSFSDYEFSADITLHEYDNIIVKTQIDWSIKDLPNRTTEEVTTSMYILDTKNVLNNMQFEIVSEYEDATIKVTSLNSEKKSKDQTVGLDFEFFEGKQSIMNCGYTIDTTPGKKNNAVAYFGNSFENLEFEFTYNIIKDQFVLASEIYGIADFKLVICEDEYDQTMPEADDDIFEIGPEKVFLQELKTLADVDSIMEMIFLVL